MKYICIALLIMFTQFVDAREYCVIHKVGNKTYERCNGKLIEVCKTINGKTYCHRVG